MQVSRTAPISAIPVRSAPHGSEGVTGPADHRLLAGLARRSCLRRVRDEEAAGSNPATPTGKWQVTRYQVACRLHYAFPDVRFWEPVGSTGNGGPLGPRTGRFPGAATTFSTASRARLRHAAVRACGPDRWQEARSHRAGMRDRDGHQAVSGEGAGATVRLRGGGHAAPFRAEALRAHRPPPVRRPASAGRRYPPLRWPDDRTCKIGPGPSSVPGILLPRKTIGIYRKDGAERGVPWIEPGHVRARFDLIQTPS